MTNTQTKAKQQENDLVANKASNSQQQKEITGNAQIRDKVAGRTKVSKARTTRPITLEERKIETKKREKEDNISSELAQEKNSISSRVKCPLCNRPVKRGVEVWNM